MGIHICFLEVKDGDYNNVDSVVFKEIAEPNTRCIGDNEFIRLDYTIDSVEIDYCENCFRPKYFDEARELVNENIEENKDRFIKILNYLESNKDTYIYVSY